ncbi:hypothetical protein COE15_00080 [Bacillus cereus]|uniref:Methanol dehydrogenase n=1 Tax=Bacillus arachidis TaxID=2819290 RepID=A0ABS3P216_9BACI|nr:MULTISPECIES: hypothetical protein [Bacillus]MBO1627223.1 hypothetical protein [Bacillus arachidis]PFE03501.1 hypothetical protein CN288_13075 [Bacillus sp. AFS023182]PGY05683.1 hypothetical protein COE15_00080 [Bacillus cereus]WIY61718.1 hypothetical protein QRY57_03915 [Bacillus arachidis]
MGFVIATLLFLVLIGMIAKSIKKNKRKVNLYKTGNGDSTASTPVFFAGSDNDSSHDCGSSFGGDSGFSGGDGGSCGGGGD